MRAAPPATHPVASSGPPVWAATLLGMLAAGTPLAWLGWQLRAARIGGTGEFAALGGLGLAAVALAGALAWRRSRRRDGEQLCWDGGRWLLQDAKGHAWAIAAPGIALDLGPLMLLRTRRALDGAVAWLPLQRADAPVSWHGMRVALTQPAPPAPAADGAVA